MPAKRKTEDSPRHAYRVLQGLNYADARVEACDCDDPKPIDCEHVVDDLPRTSLTWLREQGFVEPADAAAERAETDDGDPDSTEGGEG